jgi:hypothetical protein
MKKRVGFQFNALEDTVESIGLEMVEQLALNSFQVGQHIRQLTAAAVGCSIKGMPCVLLFDRGLACSHGQAPRADCATSSIVCQPLT